MIKVTRRAGRDGQDRVRQTLFLPYALRQKSRFRTCLDNGEELGFFLSRGEVLRDGDLVEDETGRLIEVRAQPEPVSSVLADDPWLFARICYHLGNRHVPLQIERQCARYLTDHVLDRMVSALGGTVKHEQAAFEPEQGAYAAHAHHHA